MSIPKSPMICCKKSSNFRIRGMSDNVWNFYKQLNPIILWWGNCAGSLEILSVNVEFSIANVNKNVKLVLSIGSEKVIFWFINKSDVSAIFMKGGICSFYFIKSEVSELREDILIGFFKSFVWIEISDFAPVIKVYFLWIGIEYFLINL